MTFRIANIFPPSTGVDLVFDINSLAPSSRSSIIYDADYDNFKIIIAQPTVPISKDVKFKELHLTTITRDKNKTFRAGVACTRIEQIQKYRLANASTVPALSITYQLPIVDMNIRSAFRLPLNTKYIIKGKIYLDNLEYNSAIDFSIRDISMTGMGLAISKKREGHTSPLLHLQIGQELLIGVVLANMEQNTPSEALPIKAIVKRINNEFSPTHILVGLKIIALSSEKEQILNRFIHEAQIEELKRLSGRN